MFLQTWSKYIPVIRILPKRSTKEEQTLDMNKSDFQRAAGGKKIKFSFSFTCINGRPAGTENLAPVARDLVSVLQQDDTCYQFLKQKEIVFSMNNDFQLLIRNNTPAAETNSGMEEPMAESEKTEVDNLPEEER